LIKNRYVGRTFVQPTRELQERGVRIKLNVLEGERGGKKSNSGRRLYSSGNYYEENGRYAQRAQVLEEVHVRISAPPVKYPCHLGMHTPNRETLIAANRTVEGDKGYNRGGFPMLFIFGRTVGCCRWRKRYIVLVVSAVNIP